MGWRMGEEANVIITIFNNQYSPNAAKLGRHLSYIPQVSWLNISPEKGVGEPQGRIGLIGGKGKLIFTEPWLCGQVLPHTVFRLVA